MKFATVSKSLVMGLALLLASTAFAAETKGNLHLSDTTTINGTTLKPGDYKLEWNGTGSVQLSISQGKNVVAKTQAKVVDLSSPSANSAALVEKSADGTRSLTGARFEGKKYALEIGESAGGAQAGSSK